MILPFINEEVVIVFDIVSVMEKVAVQLSKEFDEVIGEFEHRNYALRVASELRGYCRDLFDMRGAKKTPDEENLEKIQEIHRKMKKR